MANNLSLALAATVALSGRPAAADDPADAPLPTQASGIEQAEPTPIGEQLLVVPRAVLFLPKLAVWTVAQPIRLGAWAYERYQLGPLYRRGLLNFDGGFGVVPVASVGGGYGLDLGVRGFDRDLFGAGEKLVLSAQFGGQYDQAYGASVSTGDRLGPIEIGVEARYERRPHDRFTGIGNQDVTAAAMTLIDPAVDSTAVDTRFRQDVFRARATVDARIAGALSARLSGAYMTRRFGTVDGDDRSIERVYDTSRLAGFAMGTATIYGEAELRYDSRRPTSSYHSTAIDATGWLASAYAGAGRGVDGDTSDYLRYGGEVQRYIDLYRGSRVLALRVMVDAVAGTDGRTDGKIAFVDLPRLGGLHDLRGYPTDRFRDRTVALASAEYSWPLGNMLGGFGFVDAGRTADSPADLRLSGVHVGFGGGLQFHTRTSFVARVQVAATPDGDFAFQLALSPSFGRRERTGRY